MTHLLCLLKFIQRTVEDVLGEVCNALVLKGNTSVRSFNGLHRRALCRPYRSLSQALDELFLDGGIDFGWKKI